MGLLHLDLDVVAIILSHLPPHDAMQLAMTCRAARAVAISRVLEDVVIGPTSLAGHPLNSINRLSHFILANTHARIPLLKSLTLHTSAFRSRSLKRTFYIERRYDYASAESFAELLGLATGLRRLRIHRSEGLFAAVPALGDAISSLPRLDDLAVHDSGAHTFGVLSRITSRPRVIHVSMHNAPRGYPGELTCHSFTRGEDRFLHAFTSSLRQLTLVDATKILETLEPETTWPAVQDLTLCGCAAGRLSAVARAFPNVRKLCIKMPYLSGRLEQDQWLHLDDVVLHIPLTLYHPVRRLHLKCDLDSRVMEASQSVSIDLLTRTLPVVLTCCPTEAVLKAIAHSVHSLRYLSLHAGKPHKLGDTGEADLEAWIVHRIPILASVPLRALSLRPYEYVLFDKAQLHNDAATIAGCIPSLEYVGFQPHESSPEAVQSQVWFHVTRQAEEGIAGVRLLADHVSERIHQCLLDSRRL